MLLDVRSLSTEFATERGMLRAVDQVSFQLPDSQILGLVGESGCGKSVTALSILRLLREPPGRIAGGEILFDGKDLLSLSPDELRKVRGGSIGMIFQEPMTSLNPVIRIGDQIGEVLIIHQPQLSAKDRKEKVIQMLRRVGISDPERRYDSHPHELSGGMRQRVMIAMALICGPKLLLADEPTTALDVTIQAQILDLIQELQQETGMSVLLITHDLGVVSETSDVVAVMYAGQIVEKAPARQLFEKPLHPYTQGLMASIPALSSDGRPEEFSGIAGTVPALWNMPHGCRFQDRCPKVKPHCRDANPPLEEKEANHWVRCVEVRR